MKSILKKFILNIALVIFSSFKKKNMTLLLFLFLFFVIGRTKAKVNLFSICIMMLQRLPKSHHPIIRFGDGSNPVWIVCYEVEKTLNS